MEGFCGKFGVPFISNEESGEMLDYEAVVKKLIAVGKKLLGE